MTTLTSRNNPKIKQIHQLINQRKLRDETGLFVVEGIRHVGEACAAHAGVEYICYAPDRLTSDFALQLIEQQARLGIPCLMVENDTFASLSGKENPQGILAVVRQPHTSLASLSAESFKWAVALVAPQDPGNIGTVLRTIDAVGASGLILLDDPPSKQYSADPYHPSSVRASMGAIFWYPMVSATFADFHEWAKSQGYAIYGTSAHATVDYLQVDQYEEPMVLLMGSEREGLTEAQAKSCDVMLKIPMSGKVTSLNLAVATGVMLYAMASRL